MNNQKIFTIIVIIAVIVIGGYFAWSKKSRESNVNPVSNNITPNWKTYANTQYGFEFKYPSDYNIFENTAFEVLDKISKLQVTVEKNQASEPLNFFVLNIKGGGETLSSILDRYKINFDNVIIEQNKVNDNNFTVAKYDLKPESNGFPKHYETAFVEHEGFVYSFDYSSNFKNILSTFKFTK
jgi:hypothetical protein